MKINKHFHTKHGQNTSTQNRSIVSQWHSHTHTHTSMCKRLFNKVFFTFSWMTTQNNYNMYTWHTFIRWPTTDMERASLTERFVAVKNTCFFFQLHNFRYVKGDQSIEKESSTNVALFFNEIPHLPINTEPLLYHHHHYQLNHSTKYYYQHSFVRQFPPFLIAERNES